MKRWMITSGLAATALSAALVAPFLFPEAPTVQVVAAPPATVPPPMETLVATSEDLTVSLRADRTTVLRGKTTQVLMELKVAAGGIEGTAPRLPTDVVVVFDRSGSMSGQKMNDAKAATLSLIEQLGPEDRFSLVAFDNRAERQVHLGHGNKADWVRAVQNLRVGGSTNMANGLELGMASVPTEPGRMRRMLLLSDGHPDDRTRLPTLARRTAAKEMPLTAIGIGANYDEQLMAELADLGTGNFHWATEGVNLATVFADELETSRETVASGLTLTLPSTPGVTWTSVAGLPVENNTVHLGTMFAHQERSLWVTAQVQPGSGDALKLEGMRLGWTTPTAARQALALHDVDFTVTEDQRVALEGIDEDMWAAGVVTDHYNEVRQSVSAAIQSGDLDGAKQQLAAYKLANTQMNAHFQNPLVADNIAEVNRMEQQVVTLESADHSTRNNWSKSNFNNSYQGRRGGQTKRWWSSPMPRPSSNGTN